MSNMDDLFSVMVAPAASDRMEEHFAFLGRVSEAAAAKFLDRLLTDIHSLEQMPHRNPVYDRPYLKPGKYRYMISHGKYRIVYQIEERMVFVDDIQDCRQSDDHIILAKDKTDPNRFVPLDER